mgnify:CR=1 FL=1
MPGRGRRSRRRLHAPATIYHALDRARQRHPGRITLDDIVLMERRISRTLAGECDPSVVIVGLNRRGGTLLIVRQNGHWLPVTFQAGRIRTFPPRTDIRFSAFDLKTGTKRQEAIHAIPGDVACDR